MRAGFGGRRGEWQSVGGGGGHHEARYYHLVISDSKRMPDVAACVCHTCIRHVMEGAASDTLPFLQPQPQPACRPATHLAGNERVWSCVVPTAWHIGIDYRIHVYIVWGEPELHINVITYINVVMFAWRPLCWGEGSTGNGWAATGADDVGGRGRAPGAVSAFVSVHGGMERPNMAWSSRSIVGGAMQSLQPQRRAGGSSDRKDETLPQPWQENRTHDDTYYTLKSGASWPLAVGGQTALPWHMISSERPLYLWPAAAVVTQVWRQQTGSTCHQSEEESQLCVSAAVPVAQKHLPHEVPASRSQVFRSCFRCSRAAWAYGTAYRSIYSTPPDR